MDLSLCMIVKNEADKLPRCLSSVQGMVNEMIVVDTGSTDQTTKIAQSFGAQVYHYSWNNNFSAARNESLRYAQGEWILVLDADEVLNPESIPALKQAMQRDQALVINLVRQEIGAVQSPYSLMSRLFRNHFGIRFSRPYHSMVDDSVTRLLQREPTWKIINLPEVAILHDGYEPGAIATRNKLQQAKATMEGYLATHPEDAYVCAKLGALYNDIGEVKKGIALLERGLEIIAHSAQAAEENAPVLYELHYHLGIAYSRSQNLVKAEGHYRTATQQPILNRLKVGAYNNLGGLLKAKGDLSGARMNYEIVTKVDPTLAIGHYNLGMTFKAMGIMPDAIDHYRQAIALNATYAEAYQNLGVTLLKVGAVKESLEAFGQAIALYEQRDPQEALRLQQGLVEMGLLKK
ncbi:MAG: glycosyltransferase [Timaviella obliquedivisa GSE-PSE-MK23-08B]|jgi:glycosyltransferase involved in cell wall biosynthesis|nr:glycosyltransferase [Timaviella obliquedivisa GSE-PSE-MK23-08B]